MTSTVLATDQPRPGLHASSVGGDLLPVSHARRETPRPTADGRLLDTRHVRSATHRSSAGVDPLPTPIELAAPTRDAGSGSSSIHPSTTPDAEPRRRPSAGWMVTLHASHGTRVTHVRAAGVPVHRSSIADPQADRGAASEHAPTRWTEPLPASHVRLAFPTRSAGEHLLLTGHLGRSTQTRPAGQHGLGGGHGHRGTRVGCATTEHSQPGSQRNHDPQCSSAPGPALSRRHRSSVPRAVRAAADLLPTDQSSGDVKFLRVGGLHLDSGHGLRDAHVRVAAVVARPERRGRRATHGSSALGTTFHHTPGVTRHPVSPRVWWFTNPNTLTGAPTP